MPTGRPLSRTSQTRSLPTLLLTHYRISSRSAPPLLHRSAEAGRYSALQDELRRQEKLEMNAARFRSKAALVEEWSEVGVGTDKASLWVKRAALQGKKSLLASQENETFTTVAQVRILRVLVCVLFTCGSCVVLIVCHHVWIMRSADSMPSTGAGASAVPRRLRQGRTGQQISRRYVRIACERQLNSFPSIACICAQL